MHTMTKDELYNYAWMGVNQYWHHALNLKRMSDEIGEKNYAAEYELAKYQKMLDELSAIQYSIIRSRKLKKKHA